MYTSPAFVKASSRDDISLSATACKSMKLKAYFISIDHTYLHL